MHFGLQFPQHISILNFANENDKIVCRFSVSGNHKRTLMEVSPSNKDVKFEGITILQFNDDNKCIKRWNQADFLDLVYQTGAMNQ